MKRLFLFLLIALTFENARAAGEAAPRERVSLDNGWRFHNGDPQWVAPQLDYATVRAWLLPSSAPLLGVGTAKAVRPSGNLGSDIACVRPEYDDRAWRALDLPHDWGIEGPFRQELPGDTGKLPFATAGWYRKRFALPAADAGRRLTLEIDGAMSCPLVWLNGQFVGGWAYGYTSFQLDLTPYAKPGEENVLAIRLDNLPESSRWYPGAGLYRNVWLTKTGPIHVAPWGTFVTTPSVGAEFALVSIEIRTMNETGAAVSPDPEVWTARNAPAFSRSPPQNCTSPSRPVGHECVRVLHIASAPIACLDPGGCFDRIRRNARHSFRNGMSA